MIHTASMFRLVIEPKQKVVGLLGFGFYKMNHVTHDTVREKIVRLNQRVGTRGCNTFVKIPTVIARVLNTRSSWGWASPAFKEVKRRSREEAIERAREEFAQEGKTSFSEYIDRINSEIGKLDENFRGNSRRFDENF